MGYKDGVNVYKPGDKVVMAATRRIKGRVIHITHKEVWGEIAGKTLTIKEALSFHGEPYYRVEEMAYVVDNSMIEGFAMEFSADEDDEIENASFGEFFSGYAIKHS